MVVEQIPVGFDNFCYVLYCPVQRKAAVVDPGFDAAQILRFISLKELTVEYIILTHHHSDHVAECKKIKAVFPLSTIVASKEDGKRLPFPVGMEISDGQRLHVGQVTLDFLLTPGHTIGGLCIIVDKKALLTGDTLFIGDCGRTDLAGGSLAQMFSTLHEKIMNLPDELIVYPGHDYGDKRFDSLGNQKRTNKTLRAKTLKEFSMIP